MESLRGATAGAGRRIGPWMYRVRVRAVSSGGQTVRTVPEGRWISVFMGVVEDGKMFAGSEVVRSGGGDAKTGECILGISW